MDSYTKNSTITSSPRLTNSPVLARKRKRKCLMSISPVLKSTRRLSAPSSVPMIPYDQSPSSPIIETCYSPSQHRSDSPILPTKRFKPRSLFVITENNSSDSETDSYHIDSSVHFSRGGHVYIDESSFNGNLSDSCSLHVEEADDEIASQKDPEISQVLTQSLPSTFSTPVRNSLGGVLHLNKRTESTESSRKKKHFMRNGLAQRLKRLVTRQESDYRLWRHQMKAGKELPEDDQVMTLLALGSENYGESHICVQCKVLNGQLICTGSKVTLLLSRDPWDSFQITSNQVLCIHSPWKSLNTKIGTVILGISLMRRLDFPRVDSQELLNMKDSPSANVAADQIVTLQSWRCPCLSKGSSLDPTSCDAQTRLWGLQHLL